MAVWGSGMGGHIRVVVAVLVLSMAIGAGADAAGEPPPPRCERLSCQDPLFTIQYPERDTFTTQSGVTFPIPVHFYEADVLLAVGRGDLASLEAMTAGAGVEPVRTESGHGVVALFQNRYPDTNIGPYHEDILTFPVSSTPVVIDDDPEAMLAAILTNAQWVVALILDEQLPIDVGLEWALINKHPAPHQMHLAIDPLSATFYALAPSGQPVVHGSTALSPLGTPPAAAAVALTQGGREFAVETALAGGTLRFDFLHRNIEVPEEIIASAIIGRFHELATLRVGPFDGTFVSDPDTWFGGFLTAVSFEPQITLAGQRARFVYDLLPDTH